MHSGKVTKVKLKPATDNEGIIIKRTDIAENNIIKANYKNVSSAKLCTTLENSSGIKVSTVEHLLAALYIVGVDNVLIEVDNEEIPIMDGSSREFIEILENSEIKKLNTKRKFLKILNKVEFEDKGRTISIEPSNFNFEVQFQLNLFQQNNWKSKKFYKFFQ